VGAYRVDDGSVWILWRSALAYSIYHTNDPVHQDGDLKMKVVWVLRLNGWCEARLVQEGNLEKVLITLDTEGIGIAELYQREMC
jgi:hypothetical protein